MVKAKLVLLEPRVPWVAKVSRDLLVNLVRYFISQLSVKFEMNCILYIC